MFLMGTAAAFLIVNAAPYRTKYLEYLGSQRKSGQAYSTVSKSVKTAARIEGRPSLFFFFLPSSLPLYFQVSCL